MLIELAVRNLAVFEDVRVPLSPGLNIVTGETGAGKSVLVEAIRLALGEKADPTAVRAGEEEAEVSALFDLSARPELREPFEEAGFPWEEELVLRRIIPSSGRSRAYLNGRMAAQSVLADLSPLLIEMVSQHGVPFLLSRSAALSTVDDFSGTVPQASEMRRRYRRIAALRRQLEEAASRGASARDRIEELDFQVAELAKAQLKEGEEEEVAAELAVLRGGEKIRAALQGAEEALAVADESAVAAMTFALARLKEAAAIDPRLAGSVERLDALRTETQELSRDIAAQARHVSTEEERRERLEERLSELRRLKRKYHMEVPALLAHLDALRDERARHEGAAAEEERLRTELRKEEEEALRLASRLAEARRNGAQGLSPAVEKELHQVSLPGARFRAEIASRPAVASSLSASGLDEAEILFSANPGMDLRPLSQTASGGELSRVMLSIRNVSFRGRGRRSIVFDEIDVGIGGKVAERVGARLKNLAQGNQVVCVTHLPQVAAFADSHLLVTKQSGKETTATRVQPLAKQDRIMELARMISGAEVTDEARAHARELIERAGR